MTVFTLGDLPRWDDPSFLWTTELERAVVTGGLDQVEDPLLFDPQGFARLADGTLVVADNSNPRLAVVPPDQDSVTARFGPRGQGPGEILSANTLLWPGEDGSFWALDPGNQRLSRFSVTGTLLEERPIAIYGMGGLAKLRPLRWDPFFWRIFFSAADVGLLTDSVLRFDPDLGSAVPIAPMPPRDLRRARNTDPLTLLAPKGTFAPIGAGGVITARNDQPEFRHYSDAGRLISIIRVDMHGQALTEVGKAEVRRGFLLAVGRQTSSVVNDVADQIPLWSLMWSLGDTLFALEHTEFGLPEGEPQIAPEQRVWRLLSVRGHYAGVLQFPPGFGYPYWVESDRLIGTRRDEFGIATIESYRIRPPGT